MAESTGSPLMENEYVKKLLEIMKANRMSGTNDLHTIIGYVSAVEHRIAGMENELNTMRQELETALKNTPQQKAHLNVITALQEKMSKLREQLSELKQNIIDGCKNAVAAFKEKGLSALRNIAEFLQIRTGLESLRDNLDKGIWQDNSAIAKIEAVSAEYHEAGKHIKNFGRAMVGKEAIQEAKPSGKLAKTLEAPYRASRTCLVAAKRSVNAAINAVVRLEKTEKKPPVMETFKKFDDHIKQTQRVMPTTLKLRPVNREAR